MEQTQIFKNTDIKTNPVFARHETFHPRYGWFKKGYDRNEVFSKDKGRSRVVLGVGQNMVRAIRYWCLAFKILNKDNGNILNSYEPSQFGIRLLDDSGWDPYLRGSSYFMAVALEFI